MSGYSIWGRGRVETVEAPYRVRFYDEGKSEPRGQWHCSILVGRTAVGGGNGSSRYGALVEARGQVRRLRDAIRTQLRKQPCGHAVKTVTTADGNGAYCWECGETLA